MDTLPTWRQPLQFLTRPRHPEAGTLSIHRKQIYILPTRAGLLFGLALLVMLIASINYNLSLGHALVFLLGSLGLVGMLHTHRNLLGIRIQPGAVEPVFAGNQAHFTLTLYNPQSRPRAAVECSIPPESPTSIHLAPFSDTRLVLSLTTRQRGWLELPALRIASAYPLGLFTAWTRPWPRARCLVYPRPSDSPLPPTMDSMMAGERQGDAGQEDFSGLRERLPADSTRHIAWKTAARDMGQRPLLVKVFSGGASTGLWLHWLATEGEHEQRLSQLCGWVLSAEADGLDYGLNIPGIIIPPGHGPGHRHRCLEALALHTTP